jgi:hypothetical protein
MLRPSVALTLFVGCLLIMAVGRSGAQDYPNIDLFVDGKLKKTWLHDELYNPDVRVLKGSKEKTGRTSEVAFLSTLLSKEATGVPPQEVAMVRVISGDGRLARQRFTATGDDAVAALMKAHLLWQNHKTGKSWKLTVTPEIARDILASSGTPGPDRWIYMVGVTRIEVTTKAAAKAEPKN